MRPRRFEYLIAYTSHFSGASAEGTLVFSCKSKLNSKKDVYNLMEMLKENTKAHTVTINNIQLLREKRAL
ncbi:TPA: hypothetical protein ACLBZ1_004050 [Bacillus cereus]